MAERPGEAGVIEDWNERLTGEVPITLVSTQDPRSAGLESFCSMLAEAAPKVRLQLRKEDGPGPPAIAAGRWLWHSIPEGLELVPFLETAAGTATAARAPSLDGPLRARLEAVASAPGLMLFVAPQCTFCPGAVRGLMPVVAALDGCRAAVVDSVLFPEMAREHAVKAVPTLIVDGAHRLTGSFRVLELVELLEASGVSAFSADGFKRMLKEGRAESLAQMMLQKGQIFQGFLPLLADPEWSTRLGAMLVLEEIALVDRELSQRVLDHLWRELPRRDGPVRGDIVYCIGEYGGRAWAPALEALLGREETEEMREAVTEALEKVRARSGG